MRKWIIIAVVAVLFLASLWFVKNHYDSEARALKDYEKENSKLRLVAERRELQFKIATYEQKLNIRVARPISPPPPNESVVDPNE